ncbi:hypothetical protein E9993_02905 [Labilibacter sediminis]|nr:hypothetical protein E9993_02905 [Labilibacter sediminis]
MKQFIILSLVILACIACNTTKNVSTDNKASVQVSESAEDSTQYELIIFDNRFDTYLITQPSKEFYSNQYYQSWNIRYVTEWNIRHNNPLRYGDFYETHIDYQNTIDYGIDLNYRLYYYFLFIEKEYGITLIKRAKTAN